MRKSQSAMEYLMTYGWAILIIAVVLSVLFQLGVFSSGNFQPHAQAGSCQISRTIAGVSMNGQCNGLEPEFVFVPNSKSVEGASIPFPGFNFSESVWYLDTSPGSYTGCGPPAFCSTPVTDIYNALLNGGVGGNQNFDFAAMGADEGNTVTFGIYWPTNTYQCYAPVGSMSTGRWHNVIVTVQSYNTIIIYIDGSPVETCNTGQVATSLGSNMIAPAVAIGSNPPGGDEIAAYLDVSNLQLYNTTLSQPEAQALYAEGIGGAPIRPQDIVAWWPLNGNLNDYGGGNYNMQIGSGTGGGTVGFSSTWEGSYTAP